MTTIGVVKRAIALFGLLFAACTIEREIPLERFACEKGGPCDAGIPPDTGALDAAPDAEVDAGIIDTGLPVESCASATPISLDGNETGMLDLEIADFNGQCLTEVGGKDVAYWFVTPGRLKELTASTSSADVDFDLGVYVYRERCELQTEAGCADEDFAIENLVIRDLLPGAYYVVVDSVDSNPMMRQFRLEVRGKIANGSPCDPAQTFLSCDNSECVLDGAQYRCIGELDCLDSIDSDGDGETDEDAPRCDRPPALTCMSDMEIRPGGQLVLSATVTDDGSIVRSSWELLASPYPALLPPPLAPNGSSATLSYELAGEYRVRYTVVDDLKNVVACETTIDASTRATAVRVEVVWATLDSTSPVDIDAHLLEPMAMTWFDPTLDCFPNTCTSGLAWDPPGANNDPLHGGDLTARYGIEWIEIPARAQNGGVYRIGAHHADPNFQVEAEVMVFIHCDTSLRVIPPQYLTYGITQDDTSFWKVADVTFGSGPCTVTELDDGFEGPLIVFELDARMMR